MIKQAGNAIRSVREVVADVVDVLLDLPGRLTSQMAIRYGKAFEPSKPFFLEEPRQAENPEAMATVARAVRIPIATGDRLLTRWGFRELLKYKPAKLVQPDTCHAGDISEVRRIAAIAEVYYASMAPHNPYGPVSTTDCIHVDFAMPNFVIQEVIDPDSALEAMELVKEPVLQN